ncbi:hypothetical protein DL770_010393 [Monosporascus sp. CRB-9-2]|nr:hypothetical protein DL770_010393 [Monosporascus sp. CRB-9-2]
MALRLIELSCKRFTHEISDEDDKIFLTTSLDDVRVAIRQIETQLASRQSLRNLNLLTPYLNAVERYSKAIDPLCNGVPFLPYIWAPVKFILIAVYEHTQTLDKMLSAYAQIGNSLPRLSRLGDSFPEDRDFQQLFAFLYEDIMEFHRKAYTLIRKPAWKIFFSSAWGRFEHRFGDLIESITRVSALIDREAASLDIHHANGWRRKALEDSTVREQRWESEQSQALMKWLETGDNDQELKLEWLKGLCCPGTGRWIALVGTTPNRLGSPILTVKGKSVLVSQIISFLRLKRDTRVFFFFCDYHSAPYAITARIFRAFAAQVMGIAPETIPFFYDEYLAKGRRPSAAVLKEALAKILAEFDDIRLLVDGIDELPASEHKTLINELIQLAKASNHSCKLLISSQDLPSIRPHLSQKPAQKCILFLGDEKSAMEKDVGIIVTNSLEDLNQNVGTVIVPPLMEELRSKILQKSEGMLLWVRLVLSLLESSANLAELRSNVDSLPKDLEAVYEKILKNIQNRCSPSNLARSRDTTPSVQFQEDPSIGLDLHLDRLDSMPEIQRLICQVLNFRKTLEDQQTKNGLDANAVELDRTLFSQADANYQRDVQHLSQIDSYPGLSQEELLAFRSDYGPTAFKCPIRSSRHSKALRCYWEGCAYNDVGYASPRSLREHQRRHHGKPELRRVPNSIRRPARNDQMNGRLPNAGGFQGQPSPIVAQSLDYSELNPLVTAMGLTNY